MDLATFSTFLKRACSSLYFRVVSITLLILVGMFFMFKYSAKIPNNDYPNDIEKRLEEIRLKTQRIVFSIPNGLFSEGREKFLQKIREENPLLKKLRMSIEELREFFPLKMRTAINPTKENSIKNFYKFLDINIKQLDSTLANILKSQNFEDISSYIRELIDISEKFSVFSTSHQQNDQTVKTVTQFSLKKQP